VQRKPSDIYSDLVEYCRRNGVRNSLESTWPFLRMVTGQVGRLVCVSGGRVGSKALSTATMRHFWIHRTESMTIGGSFSGELFVIDGDCLPLFKWIFEARRRPRAMPDGRKLRALGCQPVRALVFLPRSRVRRLYSTRAERCGTVELNPQLARLCSPIRSISSVIKRLQSVGASARRRSATHVNVCLGGAEGIVGCVRVPHATHCVVNALVRVRPGVRGGTGRFVAALSQAFEMNCFDLMDGTRFYD